MRAMILFFALVRLCVASPPIPAGSGSEEAVNEVLDGLHAAASQADGERYFSLFAEEASFIGTDAGERWDMQAFREFAMPYFEKGQGWTYEPIERQVTFGPEDRIAWFHELLDNEKYGLARGTGVLVKEEGGWKIAQYHLAFPIPNELSPEITARIKDWRDEEQK